MVFHAALVGAAAGLCGSLFFAGLELAQQFILERLTGFVPLRAAGEHADGVAEQHYVFRPWLLWIIPGLGALLGGLVSLLAPETMGGGGDAMIDAFHTKDGVMRKRVLPVKAIASIFTLGAGGSGGREGPTMQFGAAIGSLVGQVLKVDARERRILLVAGCAAGMAAVFRTPLGAALLAVEVLYRDDFESDALIPALLASVVSYSVFVSIYGEEKLFAHAAHYAFIPAHLPLYGLMALIIAAFASLFVTTLYAIKDKAKTLKGPKWLRPGLGGLAVGILATPIIVLIGPRVGAPGQGFGILGGGYGTAQLAITGGGWLPEGWRAVELLALLGVFKIVATSFTVGSGGSAGDFGPSLVMGALFGGAFGRAAQLLFHDPRIDPGAFALVGMGTFYGGLAHVPVSSLVMVCELAGSYDLLVPLMLAEGIAFVALRTKSLYHAQLTTKRDSPAHKEDLIADVLEAKQVADVVVRDRPYITFERHTRAADVMQRIATSAWQDCFPVLEEGGKMVGVIDVQILRTLASEQDFLPFTLATDIMQPAISVKLDDNLHDALQAMLTHAVREIPVVDGKDQIVGFLDEADVTAVYLQVTGGDKSS